MKLPPNYEWLNQIGTLPRTIQVALSLLGTHELNGKGSNPTILAWRDELNTAGIKISDYTDDDIPWCGLFAAIVAHRAGKTVVKDPLWARNWVAFGNRTKQPALGDCLVFERQGGGGHVTWYVGEDDDCYHCLGGNQSDQVGFTRVEKHRLIMARRPTYVNQPNSVKAYRLKSTGKFSTNEA